MGSVDFFTGHPVFTHGEYLAARARNGGTDRTANNLLNRHLASGRILRIRRGLYAAVPRSVTSEQVVVDPYLIATKLTDDATVAYHAALQFHGKTYSAWRRFHYLTRKRQKPFAFRGMEFVPVQAPTKQRSLPDLGGGITEVPHAGGLVRVTTFERTLVDVLDAPEHSGGWEEVWRSLDSVEFFDLDAVVEFATKLGTAMTVARVGFFLEQNRERLMVEDRHLDMLRTHAPKQPRYLGKRESGKYIANWNLVVPDWILERHWEELS